MQQTTNKQTLAADAIDVICVDTFGASCVEDPVGANCGEVNAICANGVEDPFANCDEATTIDAIWVEDAIVAISANCVEASFKLIMIMT